MYAVQKDIWHLTGLDKTIVEQLLRWSNNLFNVGTYESRQRYFKDKGAIKYPDLYKIAKTNENYALLYSQVAQQSLKSVAESFSSFRALSKLAKKGELHQKPRLPNYRTTAKVKERLQQECDLRGWRFVEQDESYTSKASFLDRDLLPVKVGEKPDNWQPSGQRIKRGLYRSAQGLILNADINGAANIIRKSKVAIDSIIERVGSGLLTNVGGKARPILGKI